MHVIITHRVIQPVILITFLFWVTGCHKKTTTTQSSSGWISTFITVATPVTNAQTWNLSVFSCTDRSGNLYLSGTAGGKWVILKSSDGGTTWSEQFSHGSTSYGHQIVADSLGNVFAVGSTGSSPEYGTIKKYDAGAGLWSTAYSAQIQPGRMTYLEGIAIDSNDHIYVTGEATVTLLSPDGFPDMDVTKMIVLKSTDHGTSWNLVDSFAVDDYSWTRGTGIFIADSGEIYAYGRNNYSNRTQNVIRKTTNGGASWTRIYEDFGSSIRGLAAWGSNLILNEDFNNGTSNSTASRVRGTTDSFGHLTILDSFFPTGTVSIFTGSMKVDKTTGHVYYPVNYADEKGLSHLVVRGNRGDGEWQTLDDYVAGTDEALYANEIMIDNNGSVYNVGIHYTASGTKWLLRKATLTSTETVTPSSVGDGDDLISPIPAGAKRIYITAQTHNGFFGSTPTSAIANADNICNTDSNKPLGNNSATYKALLVNSVRRACSTANCSGGASENLDWVFSPNTNYVSREGAALGTSNNSGIFTTFSRALLTNTVDRVWTGLETTDRDWRTEPDGYVCGNWTSNDSNDWATIWTLRATDFGDIYTQFAWLTCDTAQRLLCVEQ